MKAIFRFVSGKELEFTGDAVEEIFQASKSNRINSSTIINMGDRSGDAVSINMLNVEYIRYVEEEAEE